MIYKRTIYKYILLQTDLQTLSIPGFQKALDVQVQKSVPCLWVVVNADKPPVLVEVRIIGTGCRFDDVCNDDYVGTFQMFGGDLVNHVFCKIQ